MPLTFQMNPGEVITLDVVGKKGSAPGLLDPATPIAYTSPDPRLAVVADNADGTKINVETSNLINGGSYPVTCAFKGDPAGSTVSTTLTIQVPTPFADSLDFTKE